MLSFVHVLKVLHSVREVREIVREVRDFVDQSGKVRENEKF